MKAVVLTLTLANLLVAAPNMAIPWSISCSGRQALGSNTLTLTSSSDWEGKLTLVRTLNAADGTKLNKKVFGVHTTSSKNGYDLFQAACDVTTSGGGSLTATLKVNGEKGEWVETSGFYDERIAAPISKSVKYTLNCSIAQ